MFWRRRKEGDFSSEIEAHLELEADRLKDQGLSDQDARAAARRTFGNATRAREQFHESHRWLLLDVLLQDIRFGLRMLAKSPGSTSVAVLTLALGIGANTSIFSLLNAVLLRDLPVSQPQQLVLFGKGSWAGSQDTLPYRSWQLFSYPFYREFRKKNQVYTNVAAIDSIQFENHGRIAHNPSVEKIYVELVSGTYFETLGVNPVAGRVLTDRDDQFPGAHPVALASYSWWQRRFAKDPSAIGTTVTIGSTVYSIIGVAPPQFFGTTVGQAPDLWIPLAMEKQISPGWNGLDNNLFQSLYIIARRKAHVSVDQASANTNLLFKQILQEYVGPKPSKKEIADIAHAQIEVTAAATGLSQLRIQFSSPLKILMAVVSLVLLIACANVANLLLARAAARRREVAVRMSIGAGRLRLIRQLLVESSILGLTGALLGVIFAWGASHVLLAMVFPGLPNAPLRVTPDAQVLGFTVAISILTVLLFGTVPALFATRLELTSALKEGRGAAATPAHNQLSRALIVGQVALSLMLLTGAGLFLRSFLNLINQDTGFDKQKVLIIGIDPGAAGYQVNARLESMMERIEDRVASLPSVHGASFAFLVFGGGWTDPIAVPGKPKSDNDPDVDHNIVGPQYLTAMKMLIVLGRDLNQRDTAASRKVAVINETLARVYFPGASPIGRTFSAADNPELQNIEVVGVVRDAKYMDLKERQMPAAFYPHAQHGMFLYNLVVRYAGDPKTVTPEIRSAISSVDPNLPVGDVTTLAQLVDNSVLNQRLVAQLSTGFAALAAFLACIGIYGVLSYGVTRRTNEFGLRMALGAQRRRVLWMVLGEALRLVLIGVALGLAFAVTSIRLVESELFGVQPYDPVSVGFALAAMLAAGLLAAYLPAQQATKIDPMVALRYE